MAFREEISAQTGEVTQIELTSAEIAAQEPAPTAEELLAEAKKARKKYLKEAYKYVIDLGFDAEAGGVTYRYDSDDDSKALMIGACVDIANGQVLADDFFWKCWDKDTGDRVEPVTTADELKAIYHEGVVYIETAWQTRNALKKLVKASTTIEDVDAVGWPWAGDGSDPRENEE